MIFLCNNSDIVVRCSIVVVVYSSSHWSPPGALLLHLMGLHGSRLQLFSDLSSSALPKPALREAEEQSELQAQQTLDPKADPPAEARTDYRVVGRAVVVVTLRFKTKSGRAWQRTVVWVVWFLDLCNFSCGNGILSSSQSCWMASFVRFVLWVGPSCGGRAIWFHIAYLTSLGVLIEFAHQ